MLVLCSRLALEGAAACCGEKVEMSGELLR